MFCNSYSAYVNMYAEHAAPLTKLSQVGREEGNKGSKKDRAWTSESEKAFDDMKAALLKPLNLLLLNPDKGFALRTDASTYAVCAVLVQVQEDGGHVPVVFWSPVLGADERRTWTPQEKKAYNIVCALRKWAGHSRLQPVTVCTDHQSLQSWHKEHVDTPSGAAARRARWHETLANFDLTVVYVPGRLNTVADCPSWWAYPASKHLADISVHGNEAEMAEVLWFDSETVLFLENPKKRQTPCRAGSFGAAPNRTQITNWKTKPLFKHIEVLYTTSFTATGISMLHMYLQIAV